MSQLVYDLVRPRLVWIRKNRDAATMERFFEWLGKRRARSIWAVCCDMYAIYLDTIRLHLPQTHVVFDRFHIVRHLNHALDEVRHQTWRALSGQANRAFSRTRWLWLNNPWNLKNEEQWDYTIQPSTL